MDDKIFKLPICESTVTYNVGLSWGQELELRDVYLGAAKVGGLEAGADPGDMQISYDATVETKAKFKLLELAIKKIVDKSGKDTKYTKDWAYALSPEDGQALFDEINKAYREKKSPPASA